jgi:hypothetical protein
MRVISFPRLSRACLHVVRELDNLGFMDNRVSAVDVILLPPLPTLAYGWQKYGSSGNIHIPRSSLAWLCNDRNHDYKSLRDVLRHEYGHVVADTHRGLIRSNCFTDAFGASHEAEIPWEFDPYFHVSEYAANNPSEDFAELFMEYVKYKGKLPKRFETPPIRKKWHYVQKLGIAMSAGARKW